MREVTVVGCDVGVSENDSHSGLVVVRCSSEGRVRVLQLPESTTRSPAVRRAPTLLKQHDADYFVVDAPLLPGSRTRPTSRCFRPHENLVRSPLKGVIAQAGWSDSHRMGQLLNTIQPMSCWSKDGELSGFAAAGNELLNVVSPLGWPLIDAYDAVEPRGTLEGFPKAFYLPLITDSEAFLDILLESRGEKDEAFLRLVLAPPEGSFWKKTGLCLEEDTNSEIALGDPDLICALAVALNGVLYGNGLAGVLTSAMPGFRFGHILTLGLGVSEPWAHAWRKDRMAAGRKSDPYATIVIKDVPA